MVHCEWFINISIIQVFSLCLSSLEREILDSLNLKCDQVLNWNDKKTNLTNQVSSETKIFCKTQSLFICESGVYVNVFLMGEESELFHKEIQY